MTQWVQVCTATSSDSRAKHANRFKETVEVSFECLGWISCVNASMVHSKKVLSDQNCAHPLGLIIALTHAL